LTEEEAEVCEVIGMTELISDYYAYLKAVLVESKQWVFTLFEIVGIALFFFPSLARVIASDELLARVLGAGIFLISFMIANFLAYRDLLRQSRKKPTYIQQAVAALDSASHIDRKAAIETLAQADRLEAREALAEAVHHPIQDVRIHATFKLAQKFKDLRAVPALIEVLHGKYSSAEEERRLAAALLGEIGKAAQSAVPVLLDVLHDDSRPVRVNTAWALGQIGDDTAVPGLIDALRDQERDVRKAAATALGQIRNADAVPALINALHDRESSVRQATAEALKRIGTPEALSATATTKY
jgi:HEAT repeat protein